MFSITYIILRLRLEAFHAMDLRGFSDLMGKLFLRSVRISFSQKWDWDFCLLRVQLNCLFAPFTRTSI
jgi:hypothetical protein